MSKDRSSDVALIEAVRAGASEAYAELWLRHQRAAITAARSFTTLDADDVVSEAFAPVLSAIRGGGGPTMGFRPYLLTTVRNVARDWGTHDRLTDSFNPVDETSASMLVSEDDAFTGPRAGGAYEVFQQLPSRWKEVLWYSQVEQMKPRELAPLVGLSPNAASSLVLRAKRGFREAWISSQAAAARTPECSTVLRLLAPLGHALRPRHSRSTPLVP